MWATPSAKLRAQQRAQGPTRALGAKLPKRKKKPPRERAQARRSAKPAANGDYAHPSSGFSGHSISRWRPP